MLSEPSKIVRAARKIAQLNQRDFASRVGKTQSVLSRYENGKVNPPSDITMQCMHILNEGSSSNIEQIIAKVRVLDGQRHIKIREAINLLLDKCLLSSF